jgi:hypothetical protein
VLGKFVPGEELVELPLAQPVRVLGARLQLHEVDDVVGETGILVREAVVVLAPDMRGQQAQRSLANVNFQKRIQQSKDV